MLRFAEEWTTRSKVSEALMKDLSLHLTSAQLVVLAATVALANWTNRFSESFGMDMP